MSAITRGERERWRGATLLPKAVRVTILRLLDALDAADALAETVHDHRDHACTMPHLALDTTLTAYRALVEPR